MIKRTGEAWMCFCFLFLFGGLQAYVDVSLDMQMYT